MRNPLRRMLPVAAAALLLLACAWVLSSAKISTADEGRASIQGAVTVDRGEVLAFQVKAKDLRGLATYTVFTRKGHYRTPNLSPGDYEVWVAHDGYDSPMEKVSLKPGQALTLDFALRAQAGFDLANEFRPRDVGHTRNDLKGVPQADYDTVYPPGPARTLLEKNCMGCHGTMYNHMRLTATGWREAVDRMTKKRATPIDQRHKGNIIYDHFPADQTEMIYQYLVKNFGADVPPLDIKLDELRPDEDAVADSVFIQYELPPFPGGRPRNFHDPYIAPDGGVWVDDRANRALLRIDPEAKEFSKRIAGQYQTPRTETIMHGITVDSKGRVYYADIAGGYLGELEPRSGEFTIHATNPDPDESMVQIAVDSKDDVWMGLISDKKLGELDGKTRAVKMWDLPGSDCLPYGLVVDHEDKVWMAMVNCGEVVKFDPVTSKFTEYKTPSPSAPRRLGVDKNGMIWWGEYQGNHLGMLNPKTGKMTEYSFPLRYSRAYDTWPVGDYVWITESTYQTLLRFDTKTKRFTYFPLPETEPGTSVPKIEVGKDGVIWYAYRGWGKNTVAAFKPLGNTQAERTASR